MLKLRLNSSPTSTTALTLSEEYDEIQKANIFPSVQEDSSVTSKTSMDHFSAGSGSEDALGGSNGSGNTGSSTAGSSNVSAALMVADLKTQVESLRQQLAERDATVNELQRQIQEDKRAHDKLQTRWDLFFGANANPVGATAAGAGATTIASTSAGPGAMMRSQMSTRRLQSGAHHSGAGGASGSKEETTTLTQTEMLKLNKHMDQLEADKEACVQKTVKLSVALAESKARVSTLESQLEEMQNIILIQNSSPIGFGRVSVTAANISTTPSHSTHGFSSTSAMNVSRHSVTCASVAPAAGSNKNHHQTRARSPMRRRRASLGGIPPPMDSFLPISDIQLNDVQLNDSNSNLDAASAADDENGFQDNDDDTCFINQTNNQNHGVERENEYDSDCYSLESASLGWSGRPHTYLSERSDRGRSHSERGTKSTANANGHGGTPNKNANGNGNGGRLANGLREFRNMISTRHNKPSEG